MVLLYNMSLGIGFYMWFLSVDVQNKIIVFWCRACIAIVLLANAILWSCNGNRLDL